MPILHTTDFIRQANIPPISSPVASYVIPRAQIFHLRPGLLPFRMAYATEVVQDVSADANPTVTVNTGFPFPDPAWLPQAAKVYGEYRENGVVTATGVAAYNAAAGTVTVNKTQNAGEARVYVLIPDGTVRIRAAAPAGEGSVREALIFDMPLRILHSVSQHRRPLAWSRAIPLPEDWTIRIEIESSYVVTWDHLTDLEIRIEAAPLDRFIAEVAPQVGSVEALKLALERVL